MKRIIIFFLFFLSLCSELFAQNLTAKQYIEDLEYLKTELPKGHKNLFAKITEKEFFDEISVIQNKAETLNNEKFIIELFKLTKKINDEHTRIEPPFQLTFPIEFDFFKEGIFVTETDFIRKNLLYKKLNKIENAKTKNILNSVRQLIKDDNSSYFQIYFQKFINNPEILNGLNITDNVIKAEYTIGNQKTEINSVPIKSYHPIQYSKLLRNSNKDFYWFQPIDNGEIIYFNYQNCQLQIDKPFDEFNNELFEFINKNKPKKIIIDLRKNSGGNSAILKPFLDKLKDSYLNKKGNLFILIGKQTFSSALMNAVTLKREYNSVLLGEKTSGNINHFGETRGFRLPNSKIIIGYSTKYWELWKGYEGALNPDFKVDYSVKNYKKNIDEAIEYVKSWK